MSKQFHDRHFPVRPNLDQLKNQAKDLLRAIRHGDAAAVAELRKHHPKQTEAIDPRTAKLADAQAALARSYGLPSWPRLVIACRMTDAIWRGDADAVRKLVLKDPRLLREMGAEDVQHAFDRACLQGQLETARRLHVMGGRPTPGCAMGPCETLNPDGLKFLLDLGAELADEHDDRLAPIALLLETYCRGPESKHRCLELVAGRGVSIPDTPVMALHRGRIDLLEAHLRRDANLLGRTFSHEEIYPPALGCHADHSLALRASLRKQLRFVKDESMHEYSDVTPISWGERFHGPGSPGHTWVSKPAMKLIAERGGHG